MPDNWKEYLNKIILYLRGHKRVRIWAIILSAITLLCICGGLAQVINPVKKTPTPSATVPAPTATRSIQLESIPSETIQPSSTQTVTATATIIQDTPTRFPSQTALPSATIRPTDRLSCPEGCRAQTPGCDIKGNISDGGEKIYHMPGSPNYGTTKIDAGKGERWFCTEQEALNNGWRKPKG